MLLSRSKTFITWIFKFQKDGSGYILGDEMLTRCWRLNQTTQKILKHFCKPSNLRAFKLLASDGDGKVSKDELFRMMSKSVGSNELVIFDQRALKSIVEAQNIFLSWKSPLWLPLKFNSASVNVVNENGKSKFSNLVHRKWAENWFFVNLNDTCIILRIHPRILDLIFHVYDILSTVYSAFFLLKVEKFRNNRFNWIIILQKKKQMKNQPRKRRMVKITRIRKWRSKITKRDYSVDIIIISTIYLFISIRINNFTQKLIRSFFHL